MTSSWGSCDVSVTHMISDSQNMNSRKKYCPINLNLNLNLPPKYTALLLCRKGAIFYYFMGFTGHFQSPNTNIIDKSLLPCTYAINTLQFTASYIDRFITRLFFRNTVMLKMSLLKNCYEYGIETEMSPVAVKYYYWILCKLDTYSPRAQP